MPKVSKDSAAQHHDYGPVEDRSEDIDGYTINFAAFEVETSTARPMLKGLPGRPLPVPALGVRAQGQGWPITFDGP